jgi:hypothetical protein
MDRIRRHLFKGVERKTKLTLDVAALCHRIFREKDQDKIGVANGLGNFLLPPLTREQVDLIHPNVESCIGKTAIDATNLSFVLSCIGQKNSRHNVVSLSGCIAIVSRVWSAERLA